MFEGVLKKAKVDPKQEVSRTHGFRKFFITQCDRSGMSFSTREFISGHRLPNQDASYIRVTEEDRLTQYVKAIPLLTISDNQRLLQENAELRKTQSDYLEELGELRKEFDEMKQFLVTLDKRNQKKLVGEFYRLTEDKLQDQYFNSCREEWKQQQDQQQKV